MACIKIKVTRIYRKALRRTAGLTFFNIMNIVYKWAPIQKLFCPHTTNHIFIYDKRQRADVDDEELMEPRKTPFIRSKVLLGLNGKGSFGRLSFTYICFYFEFLCFDLRLLVLLDITSSSFSILCCRKYEQCFRFVYEGVYVER